MALGVRNLCKAFGDNKVLVNLSYDFPESGVVCVKGPSGSGKTTFINIIMGLVKADSGEVTGKGKISCVFQEDRLLPWSDLYQNIKFVCDRKDLSADARCEKWVGRMELLGSEHKYPDELSGGMKRRVALARAMVRAEEPDCGILIMDEPFKGLDEEIKHRIMAEIMAESADKLIIFITHDEEESGFMAGDVLEITAD